MKKQNSLNSKKRKSFAPTFDHIIEDGKSSLKTVRERLVSTIGICKNQIVQKPSKIQDSKRLLKLSKVRRSDFLCNPRKKHSNSQLVEKNEDIDHLIKLYRKEIHRSETIVIDTRGNNNINADPNDVNNMNKKTFENMLYKCVTDEGTVKKQHTLFLSDSVIFTEKDKQEIDSIVPLEGYVKEAGNVIEYEEGSSGIFSLKSYDELTDLQDDTPNHSLKIASIPVGCSPRSLVLYNK